VGRIAGVSADDTRTRLLATAAEVFGRLGYDGASIAQITAEAGLSSGAIYAHYASKAELFVATLRAHAESEFERLLGSDSTADFASFLVARGESLARRGRAERPLLIEAVVAARRHPEVARVLTTSIAHRERQLVELLAAAQEIGELDASFSARAVVRFSLIVALGSMVAGALDLPPVRQDDWSAIIHRIVDNLRVRQDTTEEAT
jgi:AcrR family transcriptional regulator